MMRLRLGPRNRESLACWLAARVPPLPPPPNQAGLHALVAYTPETVAKAVQEETHGRHTP